MNINRILIVGCGSIGKRHLRIARSFFPSANIQVLRHQAQEKSPEHSNGVLSNLDEAVAFSPEIVVVANPATLHINTALPLAQTGAHILIEKPLATKPDKINELLGVCRQKKSILAVGYNLRFSPSLQKFHDLIKANLIGKVFLVHAQVGQHLSSWRSGIDYKESVSARRELGGGVLFELSHEIDYLRWIFGEVEWVRGTLLRQSNLEIDVEDTAHLIMGFVSDQDTNQIVANLTMDFIRHDTARHCLAVGENGSLRWDGLVGAVESYSPDSDSWTDIFRCQPHQDDSYLAEWQNFLDCISNQQMPMVTGEDGLRVLDIIEASRRSSEFGCQVEVVSTLWE